MAARAATALALLAILAVGAARAEGPSAATDAGGVSPSGSYGAYLAARAAAGAGDIETAARLYGEVVAHAGGSGDVARAAVAAFVGNGEVLRAAPVAERVLEGDPGDPLAGLVAAAAAFARGDFVRADDILAGITPGGGVDGYLLPVLRAWAAAATGDPEPAFPDLRIYAERGVLAPLYDYHAGLIRELRSETSLAGLHFARAAAYDSRWPRVSLAIAAHYGATGRTVKAGSVLAGVASRHPETGIGLAIAEGVTGADALGVTDFRSGLAEGFYDAARILGREGIVRAALVRVRLALFLHPDFPAAQLLLADVLAALGAEEPALAWYRSVPEEAPEAWDAGIEIARTLAGMDRPGEAEAVLRALADRHPRRTGALERLGRIRANDGRYLEAVAVYTEALERLAAPGPLHWPLLYGRGTAFDRAGQWNRAEDDFQRALELAPDQPLVLNYLAYSWIEQGRLLETARRMTEKAVAQRPNDGFIIDSLGWAQYRLGDYEAAVETLERALAAEPGDPVITDHYGDALWRVGRRLEARFQWRNVLRGDADDGLREAVENKLERGLGPPLAAPVPEKEI